MNKHVKYLNESVINAKISEEQKYKKIVEHAFYLHENNLMTEGLLDMVGNSLLSLGASSKNALKDYFIGFVLDKLGLKGEPARFIQLSLGNVPVMQLPKLIYDTKFLITKMLYGLFEYVIDVIARQFTGKSPLLDIARDQIVMTLSDREVFEPVAEKLYDFLKEKLFSSRKSIAKKAIKKEKGSKETQEK